MPVKLNINTAEIQAGDIVVGFQTPVKSMVIDEWRIKLTFEDGEIFHTSTGFNTTVIRPVHHREYIGHFDCLKHSNRTDIIPANALCWAEWID